MTKFCLFACDGTHPHYVYHGSLTGVYLRTADNLESSRTAVAIMKEPLPGKTHSRQGRRHMRTTVWGPMSWSASQAASAEAVSRTSRPVSSSASKLLGVTTLRRMQPITLHHGVSPAFTAEHPIGGRLRVGGLPPGLKTRFDAAPWQVQVSICKGSRIRMILWLTSI
jgi:hypothetical protein